MLDRPAKLVEYQTSIDGKWCEASSGKKFQTHDPYTGEPWALIPECDAKDVAGAKKALTSLQSLVDKMATKGIIHKNTASRYKSRLAAKISK